MEQSLENKASNEIISGNSSQIPHLKSRTPLKSETSNNQYGGINDDTQVLVSPVYKKVTCLSYIKTLTIEPALFTFIFGYIMQSSCMANMMIDKGCRYYLNYSEEICRNLSNHTHVKEEAEVLANNYSMYSDLTSLIGAFTMIIIAPWSDKYGRRLPMALASLGIIVSDILILCCVINFESRLIYIVLAKIPSQIFGGFICIMTIVFSHASEVSTEKTRTQKYTTVEISMGLGLSLGGLAGGSILRYYGYFYVYLTATIIHYFNLMWIIFFVQETRGFDITASWRKKLGDLFKLDNFYIGCKASVRSRENNGRFLLVMFFLSMCIIILTYESFGSIGFLYVHQVYDWDPLTYNSVTTTFSLSQMVILIVSIPILLRLFKIKDYTLGIIGTISMIGKFFLIGFAHCGVYIFYIGYAFGSFSGISTLAVRSGISKIVNKDELGTIFSFLATCESILPMFGTILMTKVFNATIRITPSVSYLMTSVFLLLPLTTFIMACYLTRRKQSRLI